MEADADGCTVLDDSFLLRLALAPNAFDEVEDLLPPPFLFFSFSFTVAFPPSADLKKSLMLLCLSISRCTILPRLVLLLPAWNDS
jgi:hypothetical protein